MATLIGLCAFGVGISGIKIHLDKVKQNKLFTDTKYSAVCHYKTWIIQEKGEKTTWENVE